MAIIQLTHMSAVRGVCGAPQSSMFVCTERAPLVVDEGGDEGATVI